MIERRDVMGSGLVAGLAALVAPGHADAEPQAQDDLQPVVNAVNSLRSSVENQFEVMRTAPWRGVSAIRAQQRPWLRSQQKYPDFIEVGIDVWESLHDWHVHYQQPINMARMTDGRYAMVFMFTTVLLRPELLPEYVGLPYDAETRR